MVQLEKELICLTKNCIEVGKKERPEIQWLSNVYDRFRMEKGKLGKAEADEILYQKMYLCVPKRSSDLLKIRYWRTGRHVPVSRAECSAFGRALELKREEMDYLIRAYYDRNDRVYNPGQEDEIYEHRILLLRELCQEYLDRVHPSVRRRFYHSGNDLEKSLRHLYYMDAGSYLTCNKLEQVEIRQHIASINYMSEFSRQMKLYGEIPRRTMIRHLIVLGMPFLNTELLSKRLEAFGYLPLDKTHTQVDGSCLDQLLLGLFKIYERNCTGKSPEECEQRFRHAYTVIDRYLEEQGNANLRFMYFKALKGYGE